MSKAVNNRVQQTLRRVAENLYCSDATGTYYGIFKTGGKQIKQSLRTTLSALARRRLRDLRRRVERMTTGDAINLRFAEYEDGELIGGLAKRWFDLASIKWKPSVIERERYTLQELSQHFGDLTVHTITDDDTEKWAIARAATSSPRTYNRERFRLIKILAYAERKGWLLNNPAKDIPRRTPTRYVPAIPSPAEFADILNFMRSNQGKPRAQHSADLCEGLTYVGCRKGDAAWLEWRHIDFNHETVTITGDPATGTKNHEGRVIPLFPPFARLLRDMLAALPVPPQPTDKVFQVKSCRKAFETACQELGLPHYPPHHTWRRYFISHCIMAPIDAATIAIWVGHKDGGALVQKTYTVIPEEHSRRMATRVTFDAQAVNEPPPDNVVPMTSPTNSSNAKSTSRADRRRSGRSA